MDNNSKITGVSLGKEITGLDSDNESTGVKPESGSTGATEEADEMALIEEDIAESDQDIPEGTNIIAGTETET